jgi:hypothetical protein
MQKKFETIAEKKDEEDSDNESVQSDEFEEMLYGRNKDSDDDDDDEAEMDFAASLEEEGKGPIKSKKKKKKPVLEEDEEDEDFSDADDEKGISSEFAPAEEFAEMLQSAGADGMDVGGSSAVRNTDNAHIKQLKWEQERDRWVKGGPKRKRKSQPMGSRNKKVRK